MTTKRHKPILLTQIKVDSIKPDPKREFTVGDIRAAGLGIRVRPTGDPVYVVNVRRPGSRKMYRVTLGKAQGPDRLGLAEARDAAEVAATAVRAGRDFTAEMRVAKAAVVAPPGSEPVSG